MHFELCAGCCWPFYHCCKFVSRAIQDSAVIINNIEPEVHIVTDSLVSAANVFIPKTSIKSAKSP